MNKHASEYHEEVHALCKRTRDLTTWLANVRKAHAWLHVIHTTDWDGTCVKQLSIVVKANFTDVWFR